MPVVSQLLYHPSCVTLTNLDHSQQLRDPSFEDGFAPNVTTRNRYSTKTMPQAKWLSDRNESKTAYITRALCEE